MYHEEYDLVSDLKENHQTLKSYGLFSSGKNSQNTWITCCPYFSHPASFLVLMPNVERLGLKMFNNEVSLTLL